jgi:hypothetical protein
MESHYEINVSKDGRHYFATAPRSALRRTDAAKLFKDLSTRYPESEGYMVTITYWNYSGLELTGEFKKGK